MSVEVALADRLASNAGLTALVGTRVWQLKLPQKPILPAIKVQFVDEPKSRHLRGRVNGAIARIQMDAYSSENRPDPYTEVESVLNAVDDSLVEPFTIGGRKVSVVGGVRTQAIYEGGEMRLVRMSIDYDVFSKTV